MPDEAAEAIRNDHRQTVLAVAGGLLVMFLLVTSSIILVDRFSGGPGAREAAAQSLQNGENLCEFAEATANALSALASTQPLTDEQSTALREMRRTARLCRPEPSEGQP